MRVAILAMASLPALAVAPTASAAELALLGTKLDLPIAWHVVDHTRSFTRGYGLRSTDSYTLQLQGGEMDGQRIEITASYYAPDKPNDALAKKFVHDQVDKAAKDAQMRSSAPLTLDGFDFVFTDGPYKGKKYQQRMLLSGAINGGVYNVMVFSADTKAMTPQLAQALRGARMDYAALLRVRSVFDAEAALAVMDRGLQSPLGRLEVGSGVDARLGASVIKTDGDGKPLFRKRSFNLHKTGFWTIQDVVVSTGCGQVEADDVDAYLRMTEEQKDEDADDRYVNVSAPHPARLLGLDAQSASADGGKVYPLRRSDLTRYTARDSGNAYLVQIERINGSPIENSLDHQLATMPATCRLDLPFGDAPMPATP